MFEVVYVREINLEIITELWRKIEIIQKYVENYLECFYLVLKLTGVVPLEDYTKYQGDHRTSPYSHRMVVIIREKEWLT